MIQLFIDTATEKGFIGLSQSGQLMQIKFLPEGIRNSKFLFSELNALLTRHSISLKDIALIGCGVGPGSYTGIRVGAAAAQSMAYALKIPLVAISGLEAYCPSLPGSFAVALDAKYGGVYSLKGAFDGKNVSFEETPSVIALEEVESAWQGISIIVTPQLKELSAKVQGDFVWEETIASGQLFAERIQEKYVQGRFNKTGSLQLLYLRKTQAEIEKEALSRKN